MQPVRIALAAALFAAVPAQAADLISNGSFETSPSYQAVPGGDSSTIPGGWTTINNGVEWFQPQAEYGIGPAHSGVSIIDLAYGPGAAGGGIYQDIATVAGQTYELSFWGVNSTFAGRSGTGTVDVFVGGNALGSATTTETSPSWMASDWVEFTRRFTATGATTRIQFENHQNENTNFAFIDDVSVNAVPEPAQWALLIGGFALAGAALRRRQPRAVLA